MSGIVHNAFQTARRETHTNAFLYLALFLTLCHCLDELCTVISANAYQLQLIRQNAGSKLLIS